MCRDKAVRLAMIMQAWLCITVLPCHTCSSFNLRDKALLPERAIQAPSSKRRGVCDGCAMVVLGFTLEHMISTACRAGLTLMEGE
jgi:hypothetical protein